MRELLISDKSERQRNGSFTEEAFWLSFSQNFEMNPEIGLLVGSVTKTPKIAKQAAAIKAEGGRFNMCTAMKELEQELVIRQSA